MAERQRNSAQHPLAGSGHESPVRRLAVHNCRLLNVSEYRSNCGRVHRNLNEETVILDEPLAWIVERLQ